MKNVLYAAVALLGLLVIPAQAQSYNQNFEAVNPQFFQQPIIGSASDGSTADISTERAHSGHHAARLSYQFSKRGYIDLNWLQNPVVVAQGNEVHLSLWVYGSGQNDFPSGGGLVLVDAGGETFQYNLGTAMGDALDGTGWKQVKADIDLSKFQGHWGGKNTGVIKLPLKFLGFGLGHWPDSPAHGKVYIDDVSIAGSRSAASAPGGTLDLVAHNAQPGFTRPGSPVAIDVTYSDTSGTGDEPAKVQWNAVDFHGVQTAQGSAPIDTGGNGSFTFTPPANGIYYITAKRTGAGGTVVASGDTRIAAYFTPQLSKARLKSGLPLLFGVNAHMDWHNADEEDLEAHWASVIGFQAARVGASWDATEHQQGVFNWTGGDRIVSLMNRYGIQPEWVVAYSAQWAASGDRNAKDWTLWANSPPDDAAFGAFAGALAQRYKTSVHYWEIWNEPDNGFWKGTPEQYAHLFDSAYKGIKAADPTAKVMNGGISEVGHPGFVPTWQNTIQNKPDIFAYHSHGPVTGMIRADTAIESDLKAASWKMPVWINEAGFSNTSTSSEQEQAITLAKKITMAAALGNTAYFWYDLENDGNDPTNSEHNFGLIRADHTPKASAVAARTLIDSLSGYRFLRRIDLKQSSDTYAVLFGAPDSRSGVIVLWNEGKISVPLLLTVPGKSTRTSLMGNTQILRNGPGLISVAATNEPQYISFSGSTGAIDTIPPALGVPNQVIMTSGETAQININVSNPLAGPLRGTVSLTPPAGWSTARQSLSVDLPAGGHKLYPVDLTAPGNPAQHDILNVQLSSPALPADIQGSVLLRGAIAVPRVAVDPADLGDSTNWTTPTVSLGRANLVSIYQNAPLDNMLFHGDNDLSAKVYVSSVPSGLRLSVRVRDDVFVQNEPAGSEWQGDSLQFAIVLPTGQNYEWVAALTASGPTVHLDLAPLGDTLGPAAMPLVIKRDEAAKETLYDLIIPATLPDGAKLGAHFCMTLLVNDNDGGGRKGWVEWTPGIGMTKDASQYQPIEVR